MKIITLVVGLVTGVLLMTGLVAPVATDAAITEKTFENTGAFYVEIDPSEMYSIEYDRTTDLGIVYINNEPLNVAISTGYTILAIDNAILRLQSSDETIQYKGNGSYLTGIIKLNLTISNGAISGTYTIGSSPDTVNTWPETTYTECYVASVEKQDWIMSTYTNPVKMLEDSHIHAFGQTVLTSGGSSVLALIKIDGNISDGVDISILNSNTGEEYATATIDDLSINATTVNGYINLYDLTSITFKAKILDTDDWTDVSYSAYIVPAEVTAELSDHLDPAEIALLSAIVVIGLVALIAYAAYSIRGREFD